MNNLVDDWATIKRDVLTAPPGKFRVVEVDTFQPPGEGHSVIGDYDTLAEALQRAKDGTEDTPRYVYDDKGQELSKKKDEPVKSKGAPTSDRDAITSFAAEMRRRRGPQTGPKPKGKEASR